MVVLRLLGFVAAFLLSLDSYAACAAGEAGEAVDERTLSLRAPVLRKDLQKPPTAEDFRVLQSFFDDHPGIYNYLGYSEEEKTVGRENLEAAMAYLSRDPEIYQLTQLPRKIEEVKQIKRTIEDLLPFYRIFLIQAAMAPESRLQFRQSGLGRLALKQDLKDFEYPDAFFRLNETMFRLMGLLNLCEGERDNHAGLLTMKDGSEPFCYIRHEGRLMPRHVFMNDLPRFYPFQFFKEGCEHTLVIQNGKLIREPGLCETYERT